MSTRRTVKFKVSYWRYEETSDNRLHIYLGGLTKDLKTVFVRVEDFTPFVYLQLPKRVQWNKHRCQKVFEYFQTRMKSEGPLKFRMQTKYLLHYKEKVKVMFMSFPTHRASQNFARICGRGRISIPTVGNFSGDELTVHEHNIDPILKFTSCKGIKLASWVKVTEKLPEDEEEAALSQEERRFTTADIDMDVFWRNVKPAKAPKNVIVNPRYCSYDIECYSKNHNSKLPDPEEPENAVFQISMVFGRFGDKTREKILLTLFDPLDIPGTEVRRYKTERDLLLGFTSVIQEKNPDVMLGYNIMKFDWNYMITRSDKLGIYLRFAKLGRIIGQRAERERKSWSSSAYGKQEFQYFDCHGRSNVDVLLEVERNYKLPKYSLDTVSEYFLKKHKENISARELFMLYQLTTELLEKSREKMKKSQLRRTIARALEILEERRIGSLVKEYREELKNATRATIHDLIRKAMYLSGIYCVMDTVLPIELSEKLVLWTTMEEMSNCMHIPTSYLHTRGQQIKVLAQVYRETLFNDIIIPYRGKKAKDSSKDEKYQGAIVIEANPGFYKNVATLDFAALYPTVMIAYNICYTTLLKPDDPTPDEECHVLEWEDHVGCEHDPQKRKKKKADILCKKHRYRFRKVKIIIHEDGRIERLYEGIMPKLERRLLTERKGVKKEMFKMQNRLKMQRGEADHEEIAKWKKWGQEILKKGQLSEQEEKILEVCCNVLNAQQLALKVSANSAYGAMGAKNGFIPLIPGAASVTAMGRWLITKAIERALQGWPFTKLVYGDTDSCMLHFEGKTLAESFQIAEEISHVVTHYLKCCIMGLPEDFTVTWTSKSGESQKLRLDEVKPEHHQDLSKDDLLKVLEYGDIPVDLEFENMYGKFLLLTKKRYIAYVVNKDGDVIAITKKGVVLARRDNCAFLRKAYKMLSTGILDEEEEREIMNMLYDQVNALFTRQVKDDDLIIYVGVKDIKEYAIKKTTDEPSSDTNPFVDRFGNPIENVAGPLDPRLIYRNLPQCLLGLKMIRRGDDVPPNTRLEIIYLNNPDAQHQGEKAEDFTYYRENKGIENLKPDPWHYLEKQLTKPVTELISVKYPRQPIPYEKLEVALDRVLRTLDSLQAHRLANVSRFEKPRPIPRKLPIKVGWEVLGRKVPKVPCDKFESYKFRGKGAKVEYILDSAARGGVNEINPHQYPELIDVCKLWKARNILDRLYRQKGMTKRPSKRPYRNGALLPAGMSVMLMRGHEGYPRGSLCKVLDSRAEENSCGDKVYFYSLLMDERKSIILRDIPRNHISTYLYKDGTVMKDILTARLKYREVVRHLQRMFSSVVFVEE